MNTLLVQSAQHNATNARRVALVDLWRPMIDAAIRKAVVISASSGHQASLRVCNIAIAEEFNRLIESKQIATGEARALWHHTACVALEHEFKDGSAQKRAKLHGARIVADRNLTSIVNTGHPIPLQSRYRMEEHETTKQFQRLISADLRPPAMF